MKGNEFRHKTFTSGEVAASFTSTYTMLKTDN